jgi:hypothetical protein
VAGSTFGRFWIEQMRSDPATRVFGDIRINVVVSALVFLGALAYLLIVRKPRETADELPPLAVDEGVEQGEPSAVASSGYGATPSRDGQRRGADPDH